MRKPVNLIAGRRLHLDMVLHQSYLLPDLTGNVGGDLAQVAGGLDDQGVARALSVERRNFGGGRLFRHQFGLGLRQRR